MLIQRFLISPILIVLGLVSLCHTTDVSGTNSYSTYYLFQDDLSVDIESVIKGLHLQNLTFSRKYSDSQEAHILSIAESTYPSRQEVTQCLQAQDHAVFVPSPDENNLWWCSTFDGTRLPYAITTSAVQYYAQLLSNFQHGNFASSNGIKMSGSMLYSSEITFNEKFVHDDKQYEKVYVVKMTLGWGQYCGQLCAMSFRKDRLVILDRQGSVLYVSGDGLTSSVVS